MSLLATQISIYHVYWSEEQQIVFVKLLTAYKNMMKFNLNNKIKININEKSSKVRSSQCYNS